MAGEVPIGGRLKTEPRRHPYGPGDVRLLARVSAPDLALQLTGGPLHGTYKLEQFHCHWGRSNTEGSEHTVDGKPYAGELHLVHWNCEKYPSFSEAVQHPDGLAVLGVLLQVGEESHEEIEKIVQLIPHIQFKGQKIPTGTIDPAKFLPADVSYWTYPGSLTTPPCSESVIWIIFKQPVTVSERQVEAFRTLRTYSPDEICPCEGEGQVLYNYRPPLPLGNRIMRECGSM
ncbi:unnamed protein product [Bemisia tabaci]|uniref:Carbonic anhydrase n=1 Tax=Bemisia tabaci TaxID=7038 RepID=A0A9P0AGW2_BEMTA|nr:unnamed protein product [Bemisia tabaci]